MARNAEEYFKKTQGRLASTLRELPGIIGKEAMKFSMEAFENEAWSGNHQQPWKKRKNPTKWGKPDETNRKLLKKTGELMRSVRITRQTNDRVWVGAGGTTTVHYAGVHNAGFRGVVNQNVRAFTRKMKNGKTQSVKAHSRTINQNIPKRQFLGTERDSPYLKARIRRACLVELKKIMK